MPFHILNIKYRVQNNTMKSWRRRETNVAGGTARGWGAPRRRLPPSRCRTLAMSSLNHPMCQLYLFWVNIYCSTYRLSTHYAVFKRIMQSCATILITRIEIKRNNKDVQGQLGDWYTLGSFSWERLVSW